MRLAPQPPEILVGRQRRDPVGPRDHAIQEGRSDHDQLIPGHDALELVQNLDIQNQGTIFRWCVERFQLDPSLAVRSGDLRYPGASHKNSIKGGDLHASWTRAQHEATRRAILDLARRLIFAALMLGSAAWPDF